MRTLGRIQFLVLLVCLQAFAGSSLSVEKRTPKFPDVVSPKRLSIGTNRPSVHVRRGGNMHQKVAPRTNSLTLPPKNASFFAAPQVQMGGSATVIVNGDFNADGKQDVAGLVYDSLGTQSISVLMGNGDGTFQAPRQTPTSLSIDSLYAADLNHDGRTDLVMLDDGSLDVFVSNGDGTFAPSANYSDGVSLVGAAAFIDTNNDGNIDIVIADRLSGEVSTLLGNGDGTFRPFTQLPYPGQVINGIFADVNGDGKADLVTTAAVFLAGANGYGAPTVLLNAQGQPSTCNWLSQSVAVGDVNGDGKADIATADCQNNTVTVYLGRGDGTFAAGTSTFAGPYPVAVALADLNRDGHLDIISSNDYSNDAGVLLGNGDGTFQQAKCGYSFGSLFWYAPLVADFDGDGYADVISAQNNSSMATTISFLKGTGNGGFVSAINYEWEQVNDGSYAAAYATSIAQGDFNNDGHPDFVVGTFGGPNLGITVFLSNPDGSMNEGISYGAGGGLHFVAVADFNGDGFADVAAADYFTGTVSIFYGEGNGTFQSPQAFPAVASAPANGILAADFNHDGKVDIAVAGPSGFAVLLNDGHGGFLSATNYDTNVWGWEVLQADINGDGNVDIVVVQGQSHYLSIFLGNGNGTFTQQPDIDLAAYGPTGITAADLNADGKMDLAVSVDDWTNAVGIVVLLGNGNGTFQAPTLVVSSDQQHSWPGEVKAVDINQDGKVDLVYADTGLGTVGILFGKGDGTFFASVDYPLNPNPFALALADLNGDGTLDAVVSSLSFPGMTVSLNSSGSVVALDSAPNPSAVSESVTFTATVSATVTGAKSGPTGSVTFSEGVSVLGVAPISAGAATAQLSNLSIGSHSIIASYPGDSNFQAASSAAIVQVVSKSSSQVNLVSSLNPSISGQSVIFTASVSSATAGVTLSPSGSVTFKDGSTVLGTATIVLGNVTFTASNLSVGSHSITASYSGDASFQSSTSTALTQIVNAVKNGSQTTLSSSLNPTTSGQTVIFTATVAASTQGVSTIPSGTVTFSDGVTSLGTSNLAAGQATLTVSTLSVGSHAITATYSGDSAFLTSTSTVLTQVVSSAKTASVTTLASSANPANSRQSITFTATVASGVGSVNTTPTGSVVFQDGGASLGSRTLSGGKATLKVSDMLAGTHVITAVYSGDATFAASTGTLNQVIVRGNESAADFSFTTSAPALAVTVGRSGALTLGVASVNSFSGTVSLSCGQLPAGISCQPSPASLSVASGQSLNSQLTITVAPTFVASKSDGRSRRGSIGIFLASGLLGFFGLAGSLHRKRRTLAVAVAIVTLTFMLALTGCGGTSQGPPASTTQTLQVTATAPAAIQGGTPIVHSLNITLTIQQ